MTTAVAPARTPTAAPADPRLAAFLAPGGAEVFHSVACPAAVGQADPYDVEAIHAEARGAFERLLHAGPACPRRRRARSWCCRARPAAARRT